MGKCVNLNALFGQRLRICHEESFAAERRREDCPELMILLCRYGHIFPHGGNMLGASVDGFPKVAGALRRLTCCRVHQDGDFGELTVLFEVREFAKVARILQPTPAATLRGPTLKARRGWRQNAVWERRTERVGGP